MLCSNKMSTWRKAKVAAKSSWEILAPNSSVLQAWFVTWLSYNVLLFLISGTLHYCFWLLPLNPQISSNSCSYLCICNLSPHTFHCLPSLLLFILVPHSRSTCPHTPEMECWPREAAIVRLKDGFILSFSKYLLRTYHAANTARSTSKGTESLPG